MATKEPPNKRGGSRTITIHLHLTGLLLSAAVVALLGALMAAGFYLGSRFGNAVAASAAVSQAATAPVAQPTKPASPSAVVAIAAAYPLPAQASPTQQPTLPPPPPFLPERATVALEPSATPPPTVPPATATIAASATAAADEFVLLDAPVGTAGPAATTQPAVEESVSASAPQAVPQVTPARRGLDTDGPPSPTAAPERPSASVPTIEGTQYWSPANGPILLDQSRRIPAGSRLILQPGVELRLSAGVAIYIEGELITLGKPDQRVAIVGAPRQRWDGLYATNGGVINIENTDIRGGGAGGTLISSEGGRLLLAGARLTENFGHIQVADSVLAIGGSEIAHNRLPYGAVIQADYTGDNTVALTDNRIYDNTLVAGAAAVQITHQRNSAVLSLDAERNLFSTHDGPNIELFANGFVQGALTCNALMGGTGGLSLHSQAPLGSLINLDIRDNAIEAHSPPIIPFYIENGIGRGAISEVALAMASNWWNNLSGPYAPDRHADGRGEAVGPNISFEPWLTARPACAPAP